MPVSAEGRVEHQKQNQTATSQWPVGFIFGVQLDYSSRLKSVPSDAEKVVHRFLYQMLHFLNDMSNRVEHQSKNKRPLRSGRLVLFLVFNSITHAGKKVIRLTRKTVNGRHRN